MKKSEEISLFLVVNVVRFSLFSPVREWCASDHHMPLLCRRFSSVAPDAALPAHLTVCKATAPDGAAVSACLPPHCGLFSADIAAIHREYKQTWKTLDDELAYALWPGDVDAGNIDGSLHRWAKKEVIDNDREDWKRISASMRKQPDALRYDRQTFRTAIWMSAAAVTVLISPATAQRWITRAP